MRWKVVFVGSTSAVMSDTAFQLLYPFPTLEEAEAHATCFQTVGIKVEFRIITAPMRE
jgi:hypothetical protein